MNAVCAITKLLIKEIFRKKDFYVALILMAVILVYASGMNFYNVQNISRYLLELGLTLVFFFSVILTVSLAARQYPHEREQRTLQALLAKPLGRGQFVFGKFFGSFIAGGASFFIFYVFFLGVAAFKGAELTPGITMQVFYVFLLNLSLMAALASGLSYYLTVSANVSISLLVYFFMNTYGQGLKHSVPSFLYYTLPHVEFFDLRQRFVHGLGPVSNKLLFLLSVYAGVYAAAFLFLGWIKFRRETV